MSQRTANTTATTTKTTKYTLTDAIQNSTVYKALSITTHAVLLYVLCYVLTVMFMVGIVMLIWGMVMFMGGGVMLILGGGGVGAYIIVMFVIVQF